MSHTAPQNISETEKKNVCQHGPAWTTWTCTLKWELPHKHKKDCLHLRMGHKPNLLAFEIEPQEFYYVFT